MHLSQLPSSTISPTIRKIELDIAELFAPAFRRLHSHIRNGHYDTYWLKGGRGSTKSSFAALEIVMGIMRDSEANALVLRKTGNTIRDSVLATFLWAIIKLEVIHLFDYTRSPAEITYKPTGQKIIMKGLDEPLKLKSIKIPKGYFKFLWFEEGAEYAGLEEIRNVQQSVLRGGEEYVQFITYNPPNDPAAWVNKEAERQVKGRFVHTSTYLDVPPEWLGGKFIRDADALKAHDRVAYDHEYMGLAVGRAEQIVFHGKWEEKEFETPAGTRFFFGADWGFANDPLALVRFWMKDKDLYIDYEYFGIGVDIDFIPTKFDLVPDSRKWPIKADCSRPETISYVKRKGFMIDGADKWEGCIEDGITHLKGFRKIYIHPRCKNVIQEFSLYSYKVDRVTKDILPLLVDKHNHGIDALRYGLDGYIQRRGVHSTWAKLAK